MKQRRKNCELPVEDASRRDIERVDMQREQGRQIGEQGDGHGSARECGKSYQSNEGGKMGSQDANTSCSSQFRDAVRYRVHTSPVIDDPYE